MSYRGSGYRGPGDRSRSPPRFADRRPSNASIFDGRHPGPPPRNASDAPRGPRSQFDGPPTRGPPPGGLLGSGGAPRTLRDAPPLGTTERRPPSFRERDYPDRRERSPPPRERSPPRKFPEPRDFPPRDLDVRSARRASRDGPPSAGSNYSDNPPLSSFQRGGFGGRGRGRGDFFDRGSTRGGRRPIDDRGDLFRRERSPPPRFGRDLSRDSRDAERRDERRFERREDERRPEWLDRERERERELDRSRRDPPVSRLESRISTESVPTSATHQSAQPLPINPERLAILESEGADTSIRRPSSASITAPKRETPSQTPAYLNGRADATANRYGSRGSSPPTQAPPVPAFSFSVAPSAAAHQAGPGRKASNEGRSLSVTDERPAVEEPKPALDDKAAPPVNAPTAPKAAPSAPKAHHASPPPTAPRGPRALEIESTIPASNRLQGVRSLENMAGRNNQPVSQSTTVPPSPLATRQSLPHLTSPHPPAIPRHADLSAPTGPKAVRTSSAHANVSPRPAFASPRSDAGVFQHAGGIQRGQTPPPSAPSGPRNRSFSVSPKVQASAIPPTAPKAARAPYPPRGGERTMPPQGRRPERHAAMPSFPPQSAQYNRQWVRPGAPGYGEKFGSAVPAKRDSNGEEKDKQQSGPPESSAESNLGPSDIRPKLEDHDGTTSSSLNEDRMDIDEPIRRKSNHNESQGHSARQSFFGKTVEKSEDEIASSSEDDLSEDEDETLLEAKHARKERQLKEQMVDLGERQYRATSPLESIARLARLTTKDLERVAAQREDDMEVDDDATDAPLPVPAVVHTSESDDGPDIPTPQGDEAAGTSARDRKDEVDVIPRIRRPTPEAISLPYLFKGEEVPPLHENDAVQDNLKSLEEPGDEIMDVLQDEIEAEVETAANIELDFAELYRAWREECEGLDKVKEDTEKERQQSAEPGPEFDSLLTAAINPIMEGRRLHKYSSEYALEQVLKQSEETARIEQERQDREAKKVQADMEKEARLPDQLSPEEAVRYTFVNTNRLREPETLTRVFHYLPPADTFTDKEQDIFIAAYKETPKKWGEIASLLPGRTYKDCIQHYYAFKWDNRFRDNRGKKHKGGRRGRGGKASRPSRGSALMADLRGGEELVTTSDTTTGRPKRAAAPTTFGEREVESKSSLANPSPAKKLGPGSKDGNGENGEKPAKKARRGGEAKPGRKGKTQLAALAAAPSISPGKQFLTPNMHTKEEIARAQSLEDANLLANFQAGPPPISDPAAAMMFEQERFTHMAEGPDRPKPTVSAPKTGASSYWSVPEQTDFFKYIEHFGTDFGAIATHMGTKTQTMIKNHYQRQIDGGRGDLEKAAIAANSRREAGVDIGPPPTPTPIVKRKYDNPQSSTPRAIAPQTEPGNVEEPMPAAHALPPKHASPPQAAYQPKPQYTTSAQSTPIPAQRMVPSPMPVASTPAPAPTPAAAHPRGGLQHPLGSRLGFLSSESRPGAQPPSPFRLGQEQATPAAAPRSQPPPAQPTRTLSNVSNEFMNSLRQEQERALRMQAEYDIEPRVEHMQQQPPGHVPHAHGSPASQPIAAPPPDRKPPVEERAPTPPRAGFPPISSTRQPLFGPNAGPMHSFSTPLPPFAARGSFIQSPTKAETSRPGSVPTSAPLPPPAQPPMPSATPAPAPAPTPTPAPEPPKRSNLLSILNSEPEEPKPPKRDSLPAPSRVASPGPASFPPTTTPQPMRGVESSRRETFGQPSMPQSHFHRPSYSSSTPVPPPATLKHEPSSGGMPPMQSAPKQDWPARMMGPGSHPSPPNPAPLDRDGRPPFYQPHRSSMLGLGTPRAGPSPPPNALHSRTPSLSTQQQSAPPRDQRSMLGGPPQSTPHQTSQPLHSNPYGVQQQQYPPFSQAPSQINRAHHSHNSSINDGVSILQRMHGSREDAMRYEEEARASEEQRVRQRYDAIHAEKQRADQMFHAQRMQEQDMERQRQQQQEQAYGRGPLPPHGMHPSGFGNSPFPQPRAGINLREQAAREAETAVAQEQRRFQEEQERRRQEHQQQMPPQGYREAQQDFRRRPDDPLFHQRRTTPYGGPPYAPPPPPGSRR